MQSLKILKFSDTEDNCAEYVQDMEKSEIQKTVKKKKSNGQIFKIRYKEN